MKTGLQEAEAAEGRRRSKMEAGAWMAQFEDHEELQDDCTRSDEGVVHEARPEGRGGRERRRAVAATSKGGATRPGAGSRCMSSGGR